MSALISKVKEFFGQPSSDPVNSHSEGQVYEVNPPSGVTQINGSVWEFYSPPDEAEVDIIFFHGLRLDDYENAFWKTWVARDDDEVIWPKDWLSRRLPKARIFSVSYADSATQRQSEDGNGPYYLVENLVQDIIYGYDNIGQRCPVFLVGHDLGGIVIKHLIISALSQLTLRREPKIVSRIETFLKNLYGACFYSTPSSSDVTLLDKFASRLRNPSPILHLLKAYTSETARINEEFRECRGLSSLLERMRIFAVGELLPTSYRGFTEIIVGEGSARQNADEEYTNTTADHFSVCKARGPHDSVIAKLTAFIEHGLM